MCQHYFDNLSIEVIKSSLVEFHANNSYSQVLLLMIIFDGVDFIHNFNHCSNSFFTNSSISGSFEQSSNFNLSIDNSEMFFCNTSSLIHFSSTTGEENTLSIKLKYFSHPPNFSTHLAYFASNQEFLWVGSGKFLNM
jgi:hypothetical protein